MPGKIKFPNISNLIDRYLAGESIQELADEIVGSYKVVHRRFKSADVPLRGRRIDVQDIDAYIVRYLAGESEKSLSREMGCAREVLRRRLIESGVTPRNRSDGVTARWAKTDDAGRDAMLVNAHAAVRGRTVTTDERSRSAKSRERTQSGSVLSESILAADLRSLGYTVAQQKAISIYNIDIALEGPPLAVEVFGGGWHAYGRHVARFHERVKYLLDSGWHVLIVWVDGRRYPITADCAKHIHSFAQELRSDPSTGCQYRVILGNGETAPVRKSYLNTLADIERFSHSINAAGGAD